MNLCLKPNSLMREASLLLGLLVASIGLVLVLGGCTKGDQSALLSEQIDLLEEKRDQLSKIILDEQKKDFYSKDAERLSAKRAVLQTRLANLRKQQAQIQLKETHMKSAQGHEQAHKLDASLKSIAGKLPQPDTEILALVGNTKGGRGLFGWFKKDDEWLGTNAAGTLVRLSHTYSGWIGGTDTENLGTINHFNLYTDPDSMTKTTNALADLKMMGESFLPTFLVNDFAARTANFDGRGIVLSTNKLRIEFPTNSLGIIDFYRQSR